jgi:hypothetical protein
MKSKFSKLNVHENKQWIIILCAFLLAMAFASQTCNAQTTTRLQNKAFLFLSDVIGVDMSSYKTSLFDNYSSQGHDHLFYTLAPAQQLSIFAVGGNVGFEFYNDSLGSCIFDPGTVNQPYLHPRTDRFNDTLCIMQRYYEWTNDAQVKQMVDLMKKVGSEKSVLEVSGDLSLKISFSSHLAEYRFSNYLNGVEYTGVTVSMGNSSGDVFFDDTRVWQKIGDTSINITQDQAIRIAVEYVKNYSFKHTFGNGTSVIISNLNVTGVSSANLGTNPGYAAMESIENSTLFPYWDVRVNVSNMPAKGLQGVGVVISANNGRVASAYQFSNMDIRPLLELMFLPITTSLLFTLAFVIAIPIAIMVVLVIVLRHEKKKSQFSTPQHNSKV